jgi:hypothetical protein
MSESIALDVDAYPTLFERDPEDTVLPAQNRHVENRLTENSVALAFADGDRPSGNSRYFRQPCVGALASLARQ